MTPNDLLALRARRIRIAFRARYQKPQRRGLDGLFDEVRAAVGKYGDCTARMPGKDFVVRPAIVGRPRAVGRPRRRLVVVDDGLQSARNRVRRAGNAVTGVRLGPAVDGTKVTWCFR